MVSTQFSAEDVQKISRFVIDHLGFSYSPERESDLIRGFIAACSDLGITTPASCLHSIDNPDIVSSLEEGLIKKLTIGETYFFRDKNLFLLMRDQILPDLIRTRRIEKKYLRIWCAACSTGEEPYSIAMILKYLIPDITSWDISILGTDINPGSLHAAQRGIYSKWSFREQAPVPTDRFVTVSPDGRFQISSEIKNMVRFARLNLITDYYPSIINGTTTMDIILCRNVLMYFSSEMAAFVIDKLNASLVDKGWLFVSPQEISYAQRPGFVQVKRASVFLFQKGKDIQDKKYSLSDLKNPSSTLNQKIFTKSFGDIPSASPELKNSKNIIKKPAVTLSRIEKREPIIRVSPPNGAPVPSETIPKEQAIRLIMDGRVSDAEIVLLQYEKPDKKIIGEMEMLARVFADQGDVQRALGWCDRILAADPLNPGAYHLRAVIQQDNGQSSLAIQSLRQALYADPDYIPAHLMLGMIMSILGKTMDAQRHYQVALSILSAMADDTPVDETDGMPAIKVREMISVLLKGVAAS